jgi:hypothetical protein
LEHQKHSAYTGGAASNTQTAAVDMKKTAEEQEELMHKEEARLARALNRK